MSKSFRPPYYFQWSHNTPHIAEADIVGNGAGSYVAVVAIDGNNGDLYYIRLDHLDSIDLQRLLTIIRTSRDSARYALWDLLSQKRLQNGKNALEFFHQFVRVRTVSGHTDLPPAMGSAGGAGVSLRSLLGFQGSEYRGPASAGQTGFGPAEDVYADDELADDVDVAYPTYETGAGSTQNTYDTSVGGQPQAQPEKRGPGRPPKAR
jgi:hypothetical protein